MARGGHGLPKVSTEPAMPYLSTPCGVARPRGKWPVAVLYPLGHPTPYAYGFTETIKFSLQINAFRRIVYALDFLDQESEHRWLHPHSFRRSAVHLHVVGAIWEFLLESVPAWELRHVYHRNLNCEGKVI
jgi:hypothetical protein